MSTLTKYIKNLIFFFYSFLTLSATAQVPIINSFLPASGAIGSSITITGSNFNAIAANNIVFFGGVRATVIAASSTSLTVIVPAGTGYEPISVSVNGLTAFSSSKFVTTFAVGPILENSFPYGGSGGMSQPNSIAIADIDGDGKPDIGFSENGDMFSFADTISILKNTSSLDSISFGSKFTIPISPFMARDIRIYFKDIDGDGKPDMIGITNGKLSIYRNTSTPGIISFASVVNIYIYGNSGNLASFADFESDGKTDILFSTDSLIIYQNTSSPGTINFNTAPVYEIKAAGTPYVDLADFDNDGKIDIAVSDLTTNTISILKNISNGFITSFDAPVNISIPGVSVFRINTADIDADNKTDILFQVITGGYITPGFSVLRNISSTGIISFSAAVVYSMIGDNFSVNDMDGDGKIDVVGRTSTTLANLAGIFKNTSTAGNISFEPNVDIVVSGTAPGFGFTGKNALNDFNLDGKPDILVINQGDIAINSLVLFKNRIGEPRITSFTPKHAVGDTIVTISGYNFTGVNSVRFGNIPAVTFSILSPTSISAVAAAGSSGNLFVSNSIGTDSLAVFNTPFINSFTPHFAGPGSADSVVKIYGYNFTGATSVSLGTVEASTFTVISDTEIKAITANSNINSGYSYVTVTSGYGTGTKYGFYYAGAFISDLCPPSASTTLNSDILIPGATYHWQLQIGNGYFNEVTDGGYYSGSQTSSLHLANIPSSQYGYRYRCATGNLGSSNQISTVHLIKFVNKWNGSVSTTWENPSNWSCGAVPDAGTDVIINNGAVITLNSNTTIRSLTISTGASLTVGAGYNLTILH